MTSIDVNRPLHSFRTNAGVFAGREGGYMTVRNWVVGNLLTVSYGHITGHMLGTWFDVRSYRQ